jgi:hypothetical protein
MFSASVKTAVIAIPVSTVSTAVMAVAISTKGQRHGGRGQHHGGWAEGREMQQNCRF